MTLALTNTCKPECTQHTATYRPSLAAYFTVWKQRRQLAALDDNRLKDLGISKAEASKEAARPFWDLPS